MEWSKLGLSALQAKLTEPARALIVDDEEIVRSLLGDILKTARFVIEAVPTAEQALERIRAADFDVLVTDKNLPGYDGVDLIAQVRAEGFDVPSVLITGFPSVATISRALASGASDYLPKPFDDVRMVRQRIEAVVEQRRTERLLRRVITEFRSVTSKSGSPQEMNELESDLSAFRQALAARPEVLVVEPDAQLARITETVLKGGGLSVQLSFDLADACERIEAQQPISAFVSLNLPGASQLITAAHADASLEIIVSGRPSELDEAVAAVAKGASDFVLGASEGLDLLLARVKRAVLRGRRKRIIRHFIEWLLEAAERNPAIERMLQEILAAPVAAAPTAGRPSTPPQRPAPPVAASTPKPAPPVAASTPSPAPPVAASLPRRAQPLAEPSFEVELHDTEPTPPSRGPFGPEPTPIPLLEVVKTTLYPAARAPTNPGLDLPWKEPDATGTPARERLFEEALAEPILLRPGVVNGPMSAPLPTGAKISEKPGTEIEDQVCFGLAEVEASRSASVPARSLLYACGALEEVVRFFHDPTNYPDLASVRRFLGDASQGALAVLLKAHYERLRPSLPRDLLRDLDLGRFDHPNPPSYLKKTLGG